LAPGRRICGDAVEDLDLALQRVDVSVFLGQEKSGVSEPWLRGVHANRKRGRRRCRSEAFLSSSLHTKIRVSSICSAGDHGGGSGAFGRVEW
jgi:hypothetical protein